MTFMLESDDMSGEDESEDVDNPLQVAYKHMEPKDMGDEVEESQMKREQEITDQYLAGKLIIYIF